MRDLGDQQYVQYLAVDPYSEAAIAATVVLTVTAPDGTTSTPSVTTPSTGDYRSNFALSQSGKWRWKWTVSGTLTDVVVDEVDVSDPSARLYATLAQFKQIRPTPANNLDADAGMTIALMAASRQIDKLTGERQFGLDSSASARSYHVIGRTYCDESGEWLVTDDIGSTTGLVVEMGDGTTWTALTNYQTGPDNAIARRRPINRFLRPVSSWSQGLNPMVRVTAKWGWPAIPDEIVQATLILANRLFMRKDSPEGITGNAEWGTVRLSARDPDVDALIGPYCLLGVG